MLTASHEPLWSVLERLRCLLLKHRYVHLSFIGSAWREHRPSANVREGDRFLSFSSVSWLSVWAEDASYSRRRDTSARWKQVRQMSCLSLRGEAAECVYKMVTRKPIRALNFYSYWWIIVNPRVNRSALALVFGFFLTACSKNLREGIRRVAAVCCGVTHEYIYELKKTVSCFSRDPLTAPSGPLEAPEPSIF